MSDLMLRAPAPPVTPDQAGWRWLSYRSHAVHGSVAIDTGPDEVCLVNLGGPLAATVAGERHSLGERETPFADLPRALYAPPGSACVVAGRGPRGRLRRPCRRRPSGAADRAVRRARRGARIGQRHPPDQPHHPARVPRPPAARGRGADARRQLVVVPAAQARAGPAARSRTTSRRCTPTASSGPEAFGVQRLYSRTGDLDETWTVRDGDVLLVPRGYHPFCAAHGYHGYYLNALAAEKRSMAAEDDPDLAWTRDAWPAHGARSTRPPDRRGVTMRVASAPVSFGIFELTTEDEGLPDPIAVLDAMADTGYEGTELGPPGYFGDAAGTAAALAERNLALVGSFLPLRLSRKEHIAEDMAFLDRALGILDETTPPGDTRPLALISDAFCEPERMAGAGRHRGAARRLARRRALRAPGRERPARGRALPRPRLPAGVPLPRRHLRRDAARDRPLRLAGRSERARLLLRQRPLALRRRRPRRVPRHLRRARHARAPEGRRRGGHARDPHARARPRGGVAAGRVLPVRRGQRRPGRRSSSACAASATTTGW